MIGRHAVRLLDERFAQPFRSTHFFKLGMALLICGNLNEGDPMQRPVGAIELGRPRVGYKGKGVNRFRRGTRERSLTG